MEKKISLLYYFIQSQIQLIENKYLKKKKAEIIRDAWQLARYQNIADAIIYYCENFNEDDSLQDFPLKIETIDKILQCNKNILEVIVDGISNVNHIERYNLDDWENDLPYLINDIMSWEE